MHEAIGRRAALALLALTLLTLALALPRTARAATPKLEGYLENQTSVRTGGDHETSQLEGTLQVEAEVDGEAPKGRWSVTAIGRFRVETELEPETEREADLRELYATYEGRSFSLKLGRQQVVWGKTDGLRLLDVVNPLELRGFILEDYVDIRIPLWMANLELFRGDGSLQLLVIPDLTFDDPAAPGGELFVRPSLPAGRQGPAGPDVPAVEVRPVEEPASRPESWVYGLRWAGRAGPWDLTANALYGWAHRPVLFRGLVQGPEPGSPAVLEVTPRIPRRRLVGVSGDRPLGATVLRFEATWTPDAYREVAGPGGSGGSARPVRHDLLSYALGLDWLGSGWLVSGQLFHERVLDPEDGFVDDRDAGYGTLLVERRLRADRLTLGLFGAHGIGSPELWLSPRISYRFFGRLEVELSADLLDGDPAGLFGQFADRDRVTLTTRLHF